MLPRILLAIELIALILGAGATIVSARNIESRLERIRTINNSASAGSAKAPLSLVGIDIGGRLFVPDTPDPGWTTVVFALRSESFQADRELWSTISARGSRERGIGIVAFCADVECIRLAKQSPALPFPVIAYGQVASLRQLYRADRRGEAFLLNNTGQVMEALPWRGKESATIMKQIEVSR